MSYEANMLKLYKMPEQKDVEKTLLKVLFRNNGVVKEFGAGEKIVEDIADEFNLDKKQKSAYLETIYKKENRLKKSILWHRLLFRAADSLAKLNLITRPTLTELLTNKREWMLTENGYDKALKILGVSINQKEFLSVKSYEVQKIAKKIAEQEKPINYYPFEKKKISLISRETKLRNRGFRAAVLEVYSCRCALCGLKINSPDAKRWEVEAAHIIPYSSDGKDDIWNGIALCRLHHWAFDVGWFTLDKNFKIRTSSMVQNMSNDIGRMRNYEFIKELTDNNLKIFLPLNKNHHPHPLVIKWHNENIFYK